MTHVVSKHPYRRRKDRHDCRDHKYRLHLTAPVPAQDLPRQVDLRPSCSPIENQGDLGSCTGHAIVGALEYEENVQQEQVVQLSRLFVYYNERAIEGTIYEDSGAEIRDGIKATAQYGVAKEDLWPYDPAQFTVKPSLEAYNDAMNRRALQYQSVAQTLDAMTHCLAVFKRPIVMGIQVFESFESEEVARTGVVPMPRVGYEQCLGGHAVLCVGYDLDKEVFIFRNSWGEDWGDKGYFYLPFAYVLTPNLAEDFWTIQKMS
jgi:C1A family cysteine protease